MPPAPPPLKRRWCQLPKPLETHAVQRRHTEWGGSLSTPQAILYELRQLVESSRKVRFELRQLVDPHSNTAAACVILRKCSF